VVVGAVATVIHSRIEGFKDGLLVNGNVLVDGGEVIGTGTGTTTDQAVSGGTFDVPNGNAINSFPFGAPVSGIASKITVMNGAVPKSSSGTILYATQDTTTNFSAIDDALEGNILADSGSPLTVTLIRALLTAAIKNAALNLDRSSIWLVSGDSSLTSFADEYVQGDYIFNIVGNGHTVTYDPQPAGERLARRPHVSSAIRR
jgi:hypothetical protein